MVDWNAAAPIWFNILIFIQFYFKTYWYVLFPAICGVIPFVLMRTFAIPLLTRNPVELVVIFSPRKATVLKVVSRYLPYFVHKQRLYWFAEPHKVGHNLLHIYFEGVNQPITRLERISDKEANILSMREYFKQTAGHTIIIPPSFKSFQRSWVLIINESTDEIKLQTAREAGIKGKQHYKIGILKRIGLYRIRQKAEESETSSGNANQELVSMTVQSIQEKIGDVVKGNNFSSRLAYKIIKRARYLEINWVRLLTGEFDWRILIIILLVVMVGVIGWFIMQQFQPGAPPPGLNLS